MHHIIPIIYYYHYHYFVDNGSLISDNRWLIARAIIDIIITSVNGSLQQVQWVIERGYKARSLSKSSADPRWKDFHSRNVESRTKPIFNDVETTWISTRGFYQDRGILQQISRVVSRARATFARTYISSFFFFFLSLFPHPSSSEILIPA